MATSRIVAVPGARTAPRSGWRSAVGGALATVVGEPSLWLLGALGFAMRGGVLLLAASIVILPTPVELRMLLGSNLGSAGFTPSFMAFLLLGGALLGLLALAALAVIAYVELTAFGRLVASEEIGSQDAVEPAERLSPGRRLPTLGGLFVIQLLAVGALAVAAIPLIEGLASIAYREIVRPSMGGSIYVRVLDGVRDPLLMLLAALVVVEMVSSLATRRLLLHAFGLSAGQHRYGQASVLRALPVAVVSALLRPVRRPLETLATVILVWLVFLAALVPLSWGLASAWQAVKAAYLGSAVGDVEKVAGLAIVTLAFTAAWLVALLVLGFVSALRAALWSADALR